MLMIRATDGHAVTLSPTITDATLLRRFCHVIIAVSMMLRYAKMLTLYDAAIPMIHYAAVISNISYAIRYDTPRVTPCCHADAVAMLPLIRYATLSRR